MKKLGESSRVTDAKQLVKLKNDKLTLKRHLKVTRHNNSVLKNIVDELKTKNEEIESHLQESKAEIENGTNELTLMKKTIEISELKVEKLATEVKELKANQTKLVSDLENCKSTDADLVVSQQETKECTEELENEQVENLQCQSDKKATQEVLESEIQKNQNLQDQNSVLTKSLEDLKKENKESEMKIEEVEEKVKGLEMKKLKLESDLENCKITDADLIISQQETKDCTEELEDEKNKNLLCHEENVSNLKIIVKLKTNQTQLISDLESFKSTDADLIISQQELKECSDDLDAQIQSNLQYESEMKTCESDLKIQGQKSQNLQAQNSKLTKSLDESRSSSSVNQKLANDCKNKLEYEVKEKEVFQEKCESELCQYRPAWSEWSACSKTCTGIKTRIDKCSNSDDQVTSCNQDISCPRSGKYEHIT